MYLFLKRKENKDEDTESQKSVIDQRLYEIQRLRVKYYWCLLQGHCQGAQCQVQPLWGGGRHHQSHQCRCQKCHHQCHQCHHHCYCDRHHHSHSHHQCQCLHQCHCHYHQSHFHHRSSVIISVIIFVIISVIVIVIPQSCEMSQIWQVYLCKNIGRLG